MIDITKKIFHNCLEFNPQLFREVKGRFTSRNLTITITFSLIIQGLLSLLIGIQGVGIALNYLLPWFLLVIGSYKISYDLAKEEQQGTLNFIRLSPQSSEEILMGKILGVPCLIYLGVALAIPLHFLSSLTTGIPAISILGQYLFWFLGCRFFHTLACLYPLSFNPIYARFYNPPAIAWSLFMVVWLLNSLYVSVTQWLAFSGANGLTWFFLPLGSYPLFYWAWVFISISAITHLMWKAANRRFRNLNRNLLSKSDSYQLTLWGNLWILGFFVPYTEPFSNIELVYFWLFGIIPISCSVLISILFPNRQTLLDWARYRHQNLWHDLVWGEKSPALVAIFLNLLIAMVIWIPWLLFLPGNRVEGDQLSNLQLILGLLLTVGILMIYSAIAQINWLNHAQPRLWIISNMALAIGLPPLLGGILTVANLNFPLIWAISPIPIALFMSGSNLMAVLGIFLQFAILGILTRQFTKRIQKAGESTTKALLTPNL